MHSNSAQVEEARALGLDAGARPRPRLGLIAAAMIVLGALLLRWWGVWDWNLVDLRDFLQGGRSVLEGRDIYAEYPGILPFNYPPFGAVLFAPLTVLGMPVAAWLMTSASLTSYSVITWLTARQLGGPTVALGLVALGGLALEPIQRNAVLGQVNLILVALVMIDVFLLPRRFRGVLIGVAAGVKLTPGFFALYYLFKRDWAAAGRAATAGAATVALGWLVAPSSSAAYWLGGFDKVERFGDDAVMTANQSLRGVLVRAFGDQHPPQALVLGCAGLALLMAGCGAWRRVVRGDDLAAVLSLAAGCLLASPISWTHHWIWVVPALMLGVARSRLLRVWAGSLLFFFAPMWLLPSGGLVELRYGPGQVLISASYIFAALAFLVAMAWPCPAHAGDGDG